MYERQRGLRVSRVPIIPHFEAGASRLERQRLENLADSMRAEQPELAIRESFRPLCIDRYEDGPTLHLDDLTAIPLLDRYYDVSFLQDRARFRAVDGDWLASCGPHVEAFETYTQDRLALGTVTWLHPRPRAGTLAVAQACWTDTVVRKVLVSALRTGRLRYLHPHMGNFAVWATAFLLSRHSGHPLKVIAPPPGLTRAVNNKKWFADVVHRLFGAESRPTTTYAWNLSTVARVLRELAPVSRQMVIKRPDSAGGAGNLVLESGRYRELSLGELRVEAKAFLADFSWRGEVPLLIGAWETDVLGTPSSQLWIPPRAEGPPVVEGIYLQMVEGPQGMFVGSQPHDFPSPLERLIVNRSWLLASLFQQFGYVGRCSFDMLLLGEDFDSCSLQFVECNGRWGGASAPMTLMNRLFGDWARQPYAHREIVISGLETLSFEEIMVALGRELFDARTGTGRFILYNPRALSTRPGLDYLALGATWREAARRMRLEFPQRLLRLLESRGVRPVIRQPGNTPSCDR